jgi:hypothetical protein
VVVARIVYGPVLRSAGGSPVLAIDLDVIDQAETARLDQEFERAYRATARHRQVASRSGVPHILFLGGTPARGLERDWTLSVEAVCAAYGASVSFVEQPQVLSVTRRALAADPDLVVLWAARSGQAGTAHKLAPYYDLADLLQLQQWAFEAAVSELRDGLSVWYSAGSQADAGPAAGEIRYYRKRRGRGGPGRDLMLRVHAPSNVNWQPAGEAPKARKGIEHLEKVAPTKLERSAKGGSVWKATY